MVEADKKRFVAVLSWLCKKYPMKDGSVHPLPVSEDLVEYFSALRDIPIEDLENGSRWHYGHSEFFPDRPAALRKSVDGWRSENPLPLVRSVPPPATRAQILAERCGSDKFEQFMSALTEMSREKFGETARDDQGRARPVAGDQRSRLMEQKAQLAMMAGADQ